MSPESYNVIISFRQKLDGLRIAIYVDLPGGNVAWRSHQYLLSSHT
jgi:hypothetical protein